jgi:hypothetical protein
MNHFPIIRIIRPDILLKNIENIEKIEKIEGPSIILIILIIRNIRIILGEGTGANNGGEAEYRPKRKAVPPVSMDPTACLGTGGGASDM